MKKMHIILITVFFILIVLAVIFLLGPRVHTNDCISKVSLPGELDKYLYEKEKSIPGLKKGCKKKIIWAYEDKRKTDYSIIYFHGFTATRKELTPVCENIALKYRYNIYFTRLKAHGRTSEAFKDVKANDWFNDAYETLEIGKKLGDKVIIIGTSTGCIFSSWLALRDSSVSSVIQLSPNYDVADKRAWLVYLPWGKDIVRIVNGKYISFEPQNKLHAYYWTQRYRYEGLCELMALLKFANKFKYSEIKVPVLFVYTENDKVIDIKKAINVFNKIGSAEKELVNLNSAKIHVPAGDIVSPETNDEVEQIISSFLNKNLPGN